MKKLICGCLLVCACSGLPAQSSLSMSILDDLTRLNSDIERQNELLKNAEGNLRESAEYQKELEELLRKREETLEKLSTLAGDQRLAYKASLKKWKLLTLGLGALSAGLLTWAVIK